MKQKIIKKKVNDAKEHHTVKVLNKKTHLNKSENLLYKLKLLFRLFFRNQNYLINVR